MTESVDRPEPPPLEPDERLALADALHRWAERHPEPDRPVFGYADGKFVSPRELAAVIRNETTLGERFVRDVRLLTIDVPFWVYLRSVERSRAPWWRILLGRLMQAVDRWAGRRR